MNKLYIVCVLYNSTIEEISSLEVFLRFAGRYDFIRLMIMDNSSEDFVAKNREACETIYKDRIIYVDDGGNIGISKAYNKALDTIKDDEFYVMWSDDDTVFSEEYIENVIKVIKAERTDIIGGIVRAGEKVLSPAKRIDTRCRYSIKQYHQDPGIYNDIYCINTGLTVKSTVYGIIGRYDERLFLDAVDHLFSDKLIEKDLNRIEIVPGDIIQNFAAVTDDLDSRKIRTKIYTRDWIKWWKITHKHGAFIFLSIFIANGSLIKRKLEKAFRNIIRLHRNK